MVCLVKLRRQLILSSVPMFWLAREDIGWNVYSFDVSLFPHLEKLVACFLGRSYVCYLPLGVP